MKKTGDIGIRKVVKSLNTNLFAKRMNNIRASEIRELLKITEQPDVISFAGGLPAPELFPVRELVQITQKVLLEEGEKALQYSTTEGYRPLRKKISTRMNKRFGTQVNEDHILITSGSQQALDFIGKIFIDEEDIIFCESPSYLGALNAFRAYGPTLMEVPTDDEGMIPEELEKLMATTARKKIIYVIPDFQNPTGRTWSLERRKKLLEIAEKNGVIIIEDNPYGELRFEGETLPSIKSMDTRDIVIYLGTFSKIFCPGMRVGWIAAGKDFIEKFVLVKQGADLHTSTISQVQIDKYLEEFNIDKHVEQLKRVYKSRRDTVIEAMITEFPSYAKFNKPQGGLFIWIEMPEKFDTRVLLQKSLEKGVAFVPGGSFFPNNPRQNTLRINYSNMSEERIWEGIRRVGTAMNELYSC